MTLKLLDSRKFKNPLTTVKGEVRARVRLGELRTLWINTGTLCNVTCEHCYIESSPSNDRLAYITPEEAAAYLDEIERQHLGTREIGVSGGEPFMNPDIMTILETSLARGFHVLVLTNAMRPMMLRAEALQDLNRRFKERLTVRVSLDHYSAGPHEKERGPRTWKPAIEGLCWLAGNGFCVTVAARTLWGESERAMREGFARLFAVLDVPLDAAHPGQLILFPEMDPTLDVPEITEGCWGILKKSPGSVMCASSRMVVKRKGAARPVVLACTLIPYDARFELGHTLADAAGEVSLNHPHCARFCVLGGASCSG
jgi:uncharacterized Fe-S cluster-containing radical SAM superfamily protein